MEGLNPGGFFDEAGGAVFGFADAGRGSDENEAGEVVGVASCEMEGYAAAHGVAQEIVVGAEGFFEGSEDVVEGGFIFEPVEGANGPRKG